MGESHKSDPTRPKGLSDGSLEEEPGRVLGVDPGSRRVGLALSDPGQTLASPHRTLQRKGEDPASMIVSEAVDAAAVTIVIGLPLRLDGTWGPEARRVQQLATRIEATSQIPVVLWDERFTSQEADQRLRSTHRSKEKRKALRDEAAATILLQGFLDRSEDR